MNNEYNLFSIIRTFNKWKKQIAYATIGTAILSAIALLLLPNYYQSSTTFYAASTDAAQPAPIGGLETKKFIYGSDADLDRLFSISNSSKVYNYLIDKYDLYNHYDIDPDGRKAKAKMYNELSQLYTTVKSEFGGIDMRVEDIDPQRAKDMTNDARDKVNTISQSIIKETQLKSINSFENSIANKQSKSAVLNDSLTVLKTKFDIYDSNSQGEAYASLLTGRENELESHASKIELFKTNKIIGARDSIRKYSILKSSTEKQVEKLRDKITVFNSGVVSVRKLEHELNRLNDQISLDKERLLQLQAAYDAPFSALLVVEEASIPVDKSRPKRSILLILFTLMAFVLSVLVAFLIDNYRKIDWSKYQ